MTAGGGLDLNVHRNFAIRLFQAEYLMTRFADLIPATGNMQNDLRLSSGIVFRFGGNTSAPSPDRPPVVECSTERKTVYAGSGDIVAMRAQASDPDNDPLTYSWTASNGVVEGSGPEVRWNSSGTTPGTYTVRVLVEDGRGGTADCSVDIQVEPRPIQHPTMSCSVDRSSVHAGDLVDITAVATDEDNSPLTYSWSTSGGQINGAGSSASLDTSGLAAGQYTVTSHVQNRSGGTADCSVNVDVRTPASAVAQLEERLALHSIYFPTAQPTVRNPNGGLLASQQKTLILLASDFKQYLETKPDAYLILEGHADPRDSVESNQVLSERRVESTKHFLIEHGVPGANIKTKAFGEQQNLTEAQVRDAVERNTELTPEERQRMLSNMTTILLASNRRVDVTLSTTGQESVRQYPFNTTDSLTLLKQKATTN